ncbi:MAG: hypothetical protein HW386_1975 [Gammaproteobacteria bacterium]|nr:hypothetical protein [Gammaproteobacteria bacterium]
MKSILNLLLAASACICSGMVSAHHSFASYDFDQQIPFTGVVKELKFRNPHIAMTLIHTKEDGTEEIINFIEGAPANMLVRIGLRPEMIKVGTKLTAYGSPKKTDPTVFFLRKVVLENGKEYGV